MTNREALSSKISQHVPQETIDLVIAERGLIPGDQYNPTERENRKAMDLSLADIMLFLCTQPHSVRELDYQLTQQDVDNLLRLRGGLLAKWEEPDEFGTAAQITDISDLH